MPITRPMTLVAAIFLISADAANSATYVRNMNLLYAELPDSLTEKQRVDLSELRTLGLDTIPIKGYSIAEIQKRLSNARSDATLSKFNIVLDISGILGDTWNLKTPSVCQKGQEYLPSETVLFLKQITEIGISNADKVSGYYTFDEPSVALGKVKGICKEYQQLVYNQIRDFDSDRYSRPVILSSTTWQLSDNDINRTMSNNSQDISVLQTYDNDIETLKGILSALKRNNLYSNNYLYAYPSFNLEKCTSPLLKESFQQTLDDALNSVFDKTALPSRGVSYFAYWPKEKSEPWYSMDNCSEILKSTKDHLTSLPDLAVSRITNFPKEFTIGQSVEFSVDVKNIGKTATRFQRIGVMLMVDDQCPASGCLWGYIDTSIAPNETKSIKINGNGVWKATSGMHKFTAIADDQLYVIEADKNNNIKSRTINISDKPDLAPLNLTWNPIVPIASTPVELSVEIENVGNITTPTAWLGVLYTIDGACPDKINGCQWGGRKYKPSSWGENNHRHTAKPVDRHNRQP